MGSRCIVPQPTFSLASEYSQRSIWELKKQMLRICLHASHASANFRLLQPQPHQNYWYQRSCGMNSYWRQPHNHSSGVPFLLLQYPGTTADYEWTAQPAMLTYTRWGVLIPPHNSSIAWTVATMVLIFFVSSNNTTLYINNVKQKVHTWAVTLQWLNDSGMYKQTF